MYIGSLQSNPSLYKRCLDVSIWKDPPRFPNLTSSSHFTHWIPNSPRFTAPQNLLTWRFLSTPFLPPLRKKIAAQWRCRPWYPPWHRNARPPGRPRAPPPCGSERDASGFPWQDEVTLRWPPTSIGEKKMVGTDLSFGLDQIALFLFVTKKEPQNWQWKR